MKSHQSRGTASLVLAVCLAVGLAGCATTQRTRRAEKTGFLGDYSQLQEGQRGEAVWVYVNPETKFSAYDKILIKPITIWVREDSAVGDLAEEDRQMLAAYLYNALKTALEADYTIVDRPGPGVITLRVAITEAAGSNVALDTLTSLHPVPIGLSYGQKLFTGKHSFVGEAWVETEGLDARSGERLFAAVDSRAGAKIPDFGATWSNVKDAYDYWAGLLKERLAEERAK